MTFRPEDHRPTGVPTDDPLQGAYAILETLGRRINLPAPGQVGLLMASGSGEQVAAAAQVATALALADIAQSLRAIASDVGKE